MDHLLERLKLLSKPTSSEIWELLKESETELIEEVSFLNQSKQEVYDKATKQILNLKKEKENLINIKNDILMLQKEYKLFLKTVEDTFKEVGGDQLLSKTKAEYLTLIDKSKKKKKEEIQKKIKNLSGENFEQLAEDLKNNQDIWDEIDEIDLDAEDKEKLDKFCKKSLDTCRFELWTLLQKCNIPIKPLENSIAAPDYAQLCSSLEKISSTIWKIDFFKNKNNNNSLKLIINMLFGQILNLSLDIVKNHHIGTEFELVLECAFKWSKNAKSVLNIIADKLNLKQKNDVDLLFDEGFMDCIEEITECFLEKYSENPIYFTGFSTILKDFEEKFELETCGRDLLKPLYKPKYLKIVLLLEVEMFLNDSKKVVENKKSFNQINNSILSSDQKWSSEVTLFFEEWINRISQNALLINDDEAQTAYYDTALILVKKFHEMINQASKKWYLESSWVQIVYPMMNSVWEILEILEKATTMWIISAYNVITIFRNEWNRFAQMLISYLVELVDEIDSQIVYQKNSNPAKIRKIQLTFEAILLFLTKVSKKTSASSRNQLMNKLVFGLITNLEKKFKNWKQSDVTLLSIIYSQIYSHVFKHLEYMEKCKMFTKDEKTRFEMTKLDTIMKMGAIDDPSGDLVNISFESIDEEEVVKLLGELGLSSTSDHAFQDYLILAENWDKLSEKIDSY